MPTEFVKLLFDSTESGLLNRVLYDFVASVAEMPIAQSMISGRVAIVGGGPAIPERIFVTTPESQFKLLRPDITRLITLDDEVFSRPGPGSFKKKLWVNPYVEDIEGIPPDEPIFIPYPAHWLLPQFPPEYFNTILMFRIADFSQQLSEGLLDVFSRSLAPNGHFIGSGSFFSHDPRKLFSPSSGFTLQSVQPLTAYDSYFGYCDNRICNNMGIIAQKVK